VFYFHYHYINSNPNHIIEGLFESQDDLIFCILFLDYYVIYLFFSRSIFPKQPNIGTVFLPTVQLAWAVTVHKSQGLTLPRIRLGLGRKEFSCGLTFVALSRVTSLNSLLFIERLDWERVKKLGRKFLQLRLEDLAHRYQGT
jgi:hypothetical protein